MKDVRVMTLIETLKRDVARISSDLSALQHTLEAIECLDEVTTLAPPKVEPRHLDAISLIVPEGHDTVLGYLAKHHPEMLDLLDYADPTVTQRDGFWLAHRYKAQVFASAPSCLRKAGIMRVRAWPVEFLVQRFGE